MLLMGNSYELSPANFAGDLLALLAGLFYTFYLIAVDRARAGDGALAGARHRHRRRRSAAARCFALAIGEQVMPGDWTPVILLSISSQLDRPGPARLCHGPSARRCVVGLCFLTQPIASAAIGWARL